MKIGIITYHRADNYGSALQSYALSYYLKKMGHIPEIIDYHSKGQDALYKNLFSPMRSVMNVLRNLQTLLYYSAAKKKKYRFAKFRKEYLPTSMVEYTDASDLSPLNDQYERFICGSDQIWNPNCPDFTYAYLLDFVSKKERCASYAASLGIAALPAEQQEKYYELLHDFRALSMREQQGADCLKDIINRKIDVVPDPVILLSDEEWKALIPPRQIKKKYIFCYYIGNVDGMREYARKLSKETGFDIVVVNKNLREMTYPCKKRYDVGPLEFLSLLLHSECVCTDSFHAVMFSLIFQKDFRVFVPKGAASSRSRIDHITQRMGLDNRVFDTDHPAPISIDAIDFAKIQPHMQAYSAEGTSFLHHFLHNEEVV